MVELVGGSVINGATLFPINQNFLFAVKTDFSATQPFENMYHIILLCLGRGLAQENNCWTFLTCALIPGSLNKSR